ncbi:MAG: sigma-70 family RNA polymerase sigma factor, partial [Bacteroidota bacterium]
SEEQIIEGCRKNDRKAQKMLYDRYASVMLGICMRYTKSRSEAEDVLQDGFVKIFLRMKQYKAEGSFEGWMKRAMVNTAISNYRKNLKHYYQQNIGDYTEANIDSSIHDSDFTCEEMLEIIRELPDGYRVVFNLFAVEGYKHKEISDILGIDISTSKSQFSRAKKIIQKKLKVLSVERTIA